MQTGEPRGIGSIPMPEFFHNLALLAQFRAPCFQLYHRNCATLSVAQTHSYFGTYHKATLCRNSRTCHCGNPALSIGVD